MKQSYIVFVFVVIVLQTVLTASLPKQFQNVLMQLMPKNQAIHYREARHSTEEEAETLPFVNLETKAAAVIEDVPETVNFDAKEEIVEDVPAVVANSEAKAAVVADGRQVERYNTYPVGSPPDKVYANSDFVSYGTNCEISGYDLYAISGVTDILRCGNEYCNGDRRCSHFVYRISDSTCFIKNRFGYGTASWVENREGYICGIVPSRACNVNAGSTANLLGCLSLNF